MKTSSSRCCSCGAPILAAKRFIFKPKSGLCDRCAVKTGLLAFSCYLQPGNIKDAIFSAYQAIRVKKTRAPGPSPRSLTGGPHICKCCGHRRGGVIYWNGDTVCDICLWSRMLQALVQETGGRPFPGDLLHAAAKALECRASDF